MGKVSFDFDDTLDREDVQVLAKLLVSLGYEVWIHTSRLDNTLAPSHRWNDDLFVVIKDIGIPLKRVIWTNGADKWMYLKNKKFIFHLDDSEQELKAIIKHGDTCVPINVERLGWKEEINDLLGL